MLNTKVDDKTLYGEIEGSLDTGNYEEVQEKLLTTINEINAKTVIIDLGKLNYISSAGLRILFKIKKLVDDTRIINASLAVYEIFNIAGLDQLMSVNKSLEQINMEGAEQVQVGNTGTVYKLADGGQVKVYNDDYDIDDVEEEIILGQNALAFGASNSISFDIMKAGDKYAVKFSDMPFESFTDAIKNNPDKFEEYMTKFYDTFIHMQNIECPEDDLKTVHEILQQRLGRLESILNDEQKAVLTKLIESLKDGYDLVHGDINPANFNLLDGELVLINNAKLMEGPAIYDLYALQRYFTQIEDLGEDDACTAVGLDADTVKKVKDAFYNRHFADKDDAAKAKEIETINLASTFEKFMYLATKNDEYIQKFGDLYKQKFLDAILVPRCADICELLKTL